jgi:hypothetical protein
MLGMPKRSGVTDCSMLPFCHPSVLLWSITVGGLCLTSRVLQLCLLDLTLMYCAILPLTLSPAAVRRPKPDIPKSLHTHYRYHHSPHSHTSTFALSPLSSHMSQHLALHIPTPFSFRLVLRVASPTTPLSTSPRLLTCATLVRSLCTTLYRAALQCTTMYATTKLHCVVLHSSPVLCSPLLYKLLGYARRPVI